MTGRVRSTPRLPNCSTSSIGTLLPALQILVSNHSHRPQKKASYPFIIICPSPSYLRSKSLADRIMSVLEIIPHTLLAVASLPNALTLKSNYIDTTGHENGQSQRATIHILITLTWRHGARPSSTISQAFSQKKSLCQLD